MLPSIRPALTTLRLITMISLAAIVPIAALSVVVFWDDLENLVWPVRYGYTLEIAVEVDGKPFRGSASYECAFLGLSDRGNFPVYNVEGEALALNLGNGRVLIAPIIASGYCDLERADLWNWDKKSGRSGARHAAWKAIEETRKLDADSTGWVGGLFVLDNPDAPRTLQFVDWRVPEFALGATARLQKFEVKATRSRASTGLSKRVPWIEGKPPRQIRLENRWFRWHVQSIDYAEYAAEITGRGLPLSTDHALARFEDVTDLRGPAGTGTVHTRWSRLPTRAQTIHTRLSDDLTKVEIGVNPIPYQPKLGFNTFAKAYRVSVIPWAEPERQPASQTIVRTWDPQFCIDNKVCFHLTRAWYGRGYHVSLNHRINISGTRYVLDSVSKRLYVIRLEELSLDLARGRSPHE